MKKNNLKIVKIDKNKSLFNYEKKVLIKDLVLDLKIGYFDFEKNKTQKVKFSLEIDYKDKKPSNDKDLKSIVNYDKIVKLIKKLVSSLSMIKFIFYLSLIIFGMFVMRFGIIQIRRYKQGKTKIKKKLPEQIAFLIFFVIILGLIIYSINDLILS